MSCELGLKETTEPTGGTQNRDYWAGLLQVSQIDSLQAIGLRGARPCVTSPLPATDRLEAKQLRMYLLFKRELGN